MTRTLTPEQIERHMLTASECPPSTKVLLVSTVRRLLGHEEPAPQEAPAEPHDVPALRKALELSVQAMRAPFDGGKGELERKALDAARAALGSGK